MSLYAKRRGIALNLNTPTMYWFGLNLFLTYMVHGNYRRRTGREDAGAWLWGIATLFFGIVAAVMYLLVSDTYEHRPNK